MKKHYVYLISFLLCLFMFPAYTENICSNFYNLKAELYNMKYIEIAPAIERYITDNIETKILTEEEKISIYNLITLEKVNLLNNSQSSDYKKTIYAMLKKRNDLCKKFADSNKKANFGKWFLLSWADIKSRLSEFLCEKELYTEANETKQLYMEALKKDKRFSPASLSYGLWLYFAPPIVGGGYENALKEFTKAVSNANGDAQLYQALIFRSQVYLTIDDYASCEADLKKAHNLIPNENFTKQIAEINKNNNNFFDKR